MPINNKGRLNLSEVVRRQVDKDWPAANTDYDLFVQDLIASGNLIANGLIIRNIEVSDNILTGNVTASSITANTLVLDILTANTGIFENITINGDLTVEGNTVTLNTATLTVEDKNIRIANGAADAATADGAGITIDGAGANITYEASGDKLVINKTLNVQGDVNTTGNLIANGLIIRNLEVSDDILTGNVTASTITANTLVLDIITANTFIGIDTDKVPEGNVNLYFSNARARQVFSAGRGIIIQENGVIKSVDDSDLYNLDLNGSVIQDITQDMAPILSLPTTPSSVSYVIQSLHVTNISEETALLSANVVFASNSTVTLFDKLALPVGASMELFDKSLALKPGDKLNVQSFNQSEVATSNVISAFLVYESVTEDESFVNAGTDVGNPDSNVLLYNSNLSYTILESIKISNLEDIDIPVRVYVTDANTNIKGYLTHKMPIPSNSVVDILKKPKRLERNDRIYINYTDTANTNAISAFLSGRIGAYYVLDIVPSEVTPGTQTVIGFETTSTEGTQLYYTIRPA